MSAKKWGFPANVSRKSILSLHLQLGGFTLWLFNIAMENGPFIDGLPIKNGGSSHGYVSHNQMVAEKSSVYIGDL